MRFARHRAPTVLCLHGLTRNSRDFAELAAHLQKHYRVLAPDVRGRGRSAHDPQWQNYHPGTYVNDMWSLFEALQLNRVAVIGTSMGALMAMLMAAQKPAAIAGIVLNDAGPEVDPRGVARIAAYAGKPVSIKTWQDAAMQAKRNNGDALPGLSDEQWLAYARKAYRENAEGMPVPDMDVKIGEAYRVARTAPQNLWPVFAQIQNVPILVLRGATVQRMEQEKPGLRHVTVPNRGHAPLRDEAECIGAADNHLANVRW
jgi:pimeloyl-ACP methyl ester carboxylesterase